MAAHTPRDAHLLASTELTQLVTLLADRIARLEAELRSLRESLILVPGAF